MKKISALILIMCLIIFALAACGGSGGGQGGSGNNSSGEQGGTGDGGSDEGGAGEENESGGESGDGGSNESGGESSGEGGSNDNGSGDGGSDDVKPENPNLVTFDEAIDARLSISISSSVGSYSVVDDPAAVAGSGFAGDNRIHIAAGLAEKLAYGLFNKRQIHYFFALFSLRIWVARARPSITASGLGAQPATSTST